MADNKVIDNGTLTDVTWATDEIGGVDYQRVKISVGADGAAADLQSPDGDGKAASTALAAGVMLTTSGGTLNRWVDADAGSDGNTGDGLGIVHPKLWNGATYDRQRNNLEGTLLASAARTATTAGAVITNYNARGVMLKLVVTAAGTGNLTIQLNEGINGTADSGIAPTGSAMTTTGVKSMLAYPGVLDADYAQDGRSVALPRTWVAYVQHSDASSWTYSFHYALIL